MIELYTNNLEDNKTSDDAYQVIKNYLFLLRSNTSDQKEMAEKYFENNKNQEFLYDSLIKITENLHELQDLRMQAVVLLKKMYNFSIKNGNYLKYEREKNDIEMIYETKYALESEEMRSSQSELPTDKKNKIEIDCLPYIDQHYKEDTHIKEEMNRLIRDEMNRLKSIKSYEDYLKPYKYPELKYLNNPLVKSELTRIEKGQKLNIFNPINIKYDDPAPNKYHDKTNWNKLIKSCQLSLQQLNVKNFNLDLFIKYCPDAWKKFLLHFENSIHQLEIEKRELENECEDINKQRKYDQMEALESLNEKQGKLQYHLHQNLDIQKQCIKLKYKIKKLIKYKKKKLRIKRKMNKTK